MPANSASRSPVVEDAELEIGQALDGFGLAYRDFFWIVECQKMAPPNHHERQEAEDARHEKHKALHAARKKIESLLGKEVQRWKDIAESNLAVYRLILRQNGIVPDSAIQDSPQ